MEKKNLSYIDEWIYRRALNLCWDNEFATAFAERYADRVYELVNANEDDFGWSDIENALGKAILEDFNK